jgi:hypothetical protein
MPTVLGGIAVRVTPKEIIPPKVDPRFPWTHGIRESPGGDNFQNTSAYTIQNSHSNLHFKITFWRLLFGGQTHPKFTVHRFRFLAGYPLWGHPPKSRKKLLSLHSTPKIGPSGLPGPPTGSHFLAKSLNGFGWFLGWGPKTPLFGHF